MKLSNSILLFLATIGLIVLAISSEPVLSDKTVAKRTTTATEAKSAASKSQLPRIFNFEMYKRLFHRVYKGVEEAVRRKLMLAKAFRVWISSIKYNYGRIPYYFSLNQFSDRTPEELSRMQNHYIDGDKPGNTIQRRNRDRKSIDIPAVDPEHVEEELKLLTGGSNGETENVDGLRGLRDELHEHQQLQTSRRKREAKEEPQEEVSKGVRDVDQEAILMYDPDPDEEHHKFYSFFANKSHLRVRPWLEGSGAPRFDLPDEVYVDHSETGCMFGPRDQGQCGSCYAFSAIAMAEWLHCNLTGELVAFSEQYLVDCGKATNLTRGCNGGGQISATKFIHNYGLELRASYPYRAREDQCPYDENTKPESMGYIDFWLDSGMDVPMDSFEDYLPFGPMYVGIWTTRDFFEYGSGVMDAECSEEDEGHAVVLVGHGRQNGREYWLIRNSYGVGWGEQGYFKLAKSVDCFQKREGKMFGTIDGRKYKFLPKKNSNYDPMHVKSHYRRLMRDDLKNGLV